ncbi:MAG: aldo/keto reductase [Cyclobacteriaceae bacterium]
MKNLKFSNGDEMPMLGLGTSGIKPEEAESVIRSAVEIGYRHFDCSPIHKNQVAIGEAIQSVVDSGLVTREDLWITSKLWNDRHLYNDVESACEEILEEMQLEYLDLFLIQSPVAFRKGVDYPEHEEDFLDEGDAPLEDTWTGMEDCLDADLTKHIGLSNFNIEKIQRILDDCMMKPELVQCEWHPYLPQQTLHDYCKSNKLLMSGYALMGSPDRAEMFRNTNEPLLLSEPAIEAIAEKQGCTVAQALIAYSIKRKTAAIVKASDPAHQKENFEAFNYSVDREDLRSLIVLSKFRYFKGDEYVTQGSPYKLTDIWEY